MSKKQYRKNRFSYTRTEKDVRLMEELYNRFGRGTTSWANVRNSSYYLFKKYMWILVIQSTNILKRFLDITVSLTLLILLTPLFLITALAIRIESRGSAFYSQDRVGKWGRIFRIYKFRSMIVGADNIKEDLLANNESKAGVIFKMKNDPRITRVGKFIRKFSIDELPQVWNVFKGDMSLVGPRPPLPDEVNQYEYIDRRRLDTTPGITCMWQISGRSDIDFKGQVRLDVDYIQNQSFWEDIKILLKTIPVVLFGKGAY